MTKSYKKLSDLLEDTRVVPGGAFTHTSLKGGSYYVSAELKDPFNKLYSKELDKNNILYLTEKHRSINPILIDLDFKTICNERIINTKHIQDFLNIYMKELSKWFDIEHINDKIIYVLQKPNIYKKNDIYKDGLHIIIPNIITKPNIQYIIRENILDLAKDIFTDFSNSIEDIIDKAVIEKNNWFLYGSTKPNSDVYKIIETYTYNDNILKNIDVEKQTNLFYVNEFSIQNKYIETPINQIKKEIINEYDLNSREEIKPKIINKNKCKFDDDINLEFVNELVDILKIERADVYDSWIKVGWCLHNINEDKLLDTWINFSKQSRKFIDNQCEKIWYNMKLSGLSLGSLCYWAKLDDPNRYYQVLAKHKNVNDTLKNCKCTHLSIVNAIYPLLQDHYICDGINWYYFNDNYWINDTQNLRIKKELGTTIKQQFIFALNDILSVNIELDNTTTSTNKSQPRGKELLSIINKLEDNSYKEKILNELKLYLSDTNILNKMDSNKYLIGFENGVYDLINCEFRKGECEDYVMKTVGYNYTDLIDYDIRLYLNKYFESLFGTNEDTEFLLKTIAYGLSGNKYLEEFFIWTGKGRNGKGSTMRLIQNTLGNYYKDIDSKNLTDNNRRSGSTQSEIAQLQGVRFVSTSEPESNESLQVSKLKLWSGNDEIIARELYKASITFQPMFAMYIQCNSIPKLSKLDEALVKRINIINFCYKFEYEPKKDNQKLIDTTIKEKFYDIKYKQQFMLILLEYYSKYIYGNQKIDKPKNILDDTHEYLEENNIIREWLFEKYEITNNIKDRIKTKEVLSDYIFDTGNKITSSQLRHYMDLSGIDYKKIGGNTYFLGFIKKNIVDDYYDDCKDM